MHEYIFFFLQNLYRNLDIISGIKCVKIRLFYFAEYNLSFCNVFVGLMSNEHKDSNNKTLT